MMETHAGAVAFRDTAAGREYLVITSTAGNEWVLPKGHIKKAETIPEAALRELLEETGVSGMIIGQLKPVTFKTNQERVSVSFLLVRSAGEHEARENRSVEWLPYPEARARLSFDETRSVLDEAETILKDRCLCKIAFITTVLENQIGFFDTESSKHKRLYRRWLRYPSIIMTALTGGLATLAITIPEHKLIFNLSIVVISVLLTILVAVEALRMPRDLWIHERNIYYALKDLLRYVQYRSLEPSCSEQTLDAAFDQLQSILGSSGKEWQAFLRKQEAAQAEKKPET